MKILLLISLALSCRRDNPDDRANVDANIGRGQIGDLAFIEPNGLLLVTQAAPAELTLRASSPSFALSFTRTTAAAATIKLTITNFPSRLPTRWVGVSGPAPTSEGLTSTWELSIPDGVQTFSLETIPLPPVPFDFLAMGDIQDGVENLEDVVQAINAVENVDFLLFLGDVTMQSEKGEFDEVVRKFSAVNIPIYSTPGNHDTRELGLYHRYFGRGAYSFTYRTVRFTSVDSASWGLSKTVWGWYRNWLTLGREQTHIVYSHIAPTESFGLRGGHWASRREANAFIAHASRNDVDGMFFGHLHTLDRFSLAGIPTVISGGAGAFEEHLDGIGRHLLKVHVDPAPQSVQTTVIRVD